jgi:hypothetical protein
MIKQVSEIRHPPYGFYDLENQPMMADPSREDIEQAISAQELEKRGFQTHLPALKKEWEEGLSFPTDKEEYAQRCRTYHARRIAYFVVNGWDGELIELKADGVSVSDGLHRLRAAIYMRKETVDVKVLVET